MGRIKAVEREHRAIRVATDYRLAAIGNDPAIVQGHGERPDIKKASDNLEGTYIVRIFSEFETALQHFIRVFQIRKPRTTKALVNRVRARGKIPQDVADDVHRVRDFRNALVHERSAPADPVTIREATSSLCTFLSRVQGMW